MTEPTRTTQHAVMPLSLSKVVDLDPNTVRRASNWVNLGLFKITFQYESQNVPKQILKSPRFFSFNVHQVQLVKSQNVLKLILKSPRFVPFGTNLISMDRPAQ